MGHKTTATHREGLSFDIEVDGHMLKVDADEAFGGKNYGPKPKPLLLSALAGCTGMDVASILGKMKMPYNSFNIEVEGESTDEHPSIYKAIHLKYIFTGNELDKDKIEKAVDLSQTKYCGVSAMLKKAAEITYEIVLNP
jgi:putative redox protein